MSLQPYKFVVQAVVQRTDSDGAVVEELNADPVVVFGCVGLAEWATGFPAKLETADQA